jgi:hypothetical protein
MSDTPGVRIGANPTTPKRNVRPRVRLFFALAPDLARRLRATLARAPHGDMLDAL